MENPTLGIRCRIIARIPTGIHRLDRNSHKIRSDPSRSGRRIKSPGIISGGFDVRLSLEEELTIKYVDDDIEGIEVVSICYCFIFRNTCNACNRNISSLKSNIAESNSFFCSAMASSSSF